MVGGYDCVLKVIEVIIIVNGFRGLWELDLVHALVLDVELIDVLVSVSKDVDHVFMGECKAFLEAKVIGLRPKLVEFEVFT